MQEAREKVLSALENWRWNANPSNTCPAVENGKVCGKPAKKLGSDNVLYCKKHANDQRGIRTRQPSGRSIPRKRIRLTCKRPASCLLAPQAAMQRIGNQFRSTCPYVTPGVGQCQKLPRRNAEHLWEGQFYCTEHVVKLKRELGAASKLAVCSIDNYTDE